jgi:methyl-accepting chemotaxis protein
MQEVVNAVKRVTDIMGEISAASTEQSQGIEQVNKAITQMDETTQQNAALVEQAAAAAESMQDQAASLSQAVSVFRSHAAGGRSLKAPAHSAASAGASPGLRNRADKPVPVRATQKPSQKSTATSHRSGDADWQEF